MIPAIKINRSATVSSRDHRDFNDKLRYELSSLYHRSLAITSELNALSSMITLTEKSTVSMMRKYIDTLNLLNSDVIIDAQTAPIFPADLTDLQKAEQHSEFGIISAKRIESASVFLNSIGKLHDHLRVTRTTLNGIVDESPDQIIENNTKHIFDRNIPYIIKFEKENLLRASIYLDIMSDSIPIRLNALRFIPYPGTGSVILDGYWKDGSFPVKTNGNMSYEKPLGTYEGDVDPSYDQYTLPGYIHSELINTLNLRLGFSSINYITELQSIVIGLGAVVGELNVYSEKSYIGYELQIPEGKSLKNLQIHSDIYSPSLSNMSIYIYNDINHFNTMNDNYITRTYGSTDLNISGPGPLYLLVELDSVNNISPALSKITARFE